MRIQIAYLGRAYPLAKQLPGQLQLAERAGIAEALSEIAKLLGEGNQLPGSCLVTVAGEHLGTISRHTERSLRDGDELVLIAPVAGG